MKVFFSVSSRTNIDKSFLDDAKYISDFAAKEGCDLVIGVAINDGMPGEVLRSFRDNNRNIYLKTLKIYREDQDEFHYVDFEYVSDTFERTKRIYDESDVLVLMPGGTGTTSEIFGFLEQARTDSYEEKKPKSIIIYNKDGHYDKILDLINSVFVANGFNNSDIMNYFSVFEDRDDLCNYLASLSER